MIEIPVSKALRCIQRTALGDFVYRSALRFPDRTAVVDGDIRVDYAALDACSSRFAHWLLNKIGSGKQVGMLCLNSADMVVAYNGIHKSVNVWVPALLTTCCDTPRSPWLSWTKPFTQHPAWRCYCSG